jgi:dinuclear metal center YbgI/SA1388 family protein
MTVKEFYNKLTELYPESLSCEWDNDGLMCCTDTSAEVKKVLVTLDVTDEALHYARDNGFDVILSHHPMIFKGLKAVCDNSLTGSRAVFAIKNGISVISLHTRLDAGICGVNDCLAKLLDLTDIAVFGDDECPTLGRIGTTDSTSEDFISNLKNALGIKKVSAYLTRDIKRVAVVGGSGKDFIYPAIAAGADTLVTGECSYNAALDAASSGLNIIEAGHYATEFPVCQRLKELAECIANAEAEIFEIDIIKEM